MRTELYLRQTELLKTAEGREGSSQQLLAVDVGHALCGELAALAGFC